MGESHADPTSPSDPGPPRQRPRIAQTVVVVVLSLTGASIYAPREFWPICNYPMFAHVARRVDHTTLELRVGYADGAEREYPVEDPVLYRELDRHSAWILASQVLRRTSADGPEMTRLLALLLEGLHEERPRHAAPSETPRSLRLYRVHRGWHEDALRPHETKRRLLHEVTRDAGR